MVGSEDPCLACGSVLGTSTNESLSFQVCRHLKLAKASEKVVFPIKVELQNVGDILATGHTSEVGSFYKKRVVRERLSCSFSS